jgi:hypothetical protein
MPACRSRPAAPPPSSTASAIGIMISAVEVFEISIDSSAAAIMKASSSRAGPADLPHHPQDRER